MHHQRSLTPLCVGEANGFAEREAALTMLDRLPRRSRRTLAADKAYDTTDFVAALRHRQVTPLTTINDRPASEDASAVMPRPERRRVAIA